MEGRAVRRRERSGRKKADVQEQGRGEGTHGRRRGSGVLRRTGRLKQKNVHLKGRSRMKASGYLRGGAAMG